MPFSPRVNRRAPRPRGKIGRLVAAAACATALAAAGWSAADDWPRWRGPDGRGVWTESGIAPAFPAAGLTVRWRAEVGPGYSSPVVAAGRVYLTDAELAAPAARERVHCFDASTGRPIWTRADVVKYPDYAFAPPPGMGPTATPVVDDGRVYTVGAVGRLSCLDARNGNVLWVRRLDEEYQVLPMSSNASPLVEGDLLIVAVGGKPKACVVAFDKHSGKEVWRALDEPGTNSSPAVVTVGGVKVVVVWTQESVTALDPASGRTRWRVPLRTSRDQAVSTPVAEGDRVLISGLMLKTEADPPRASIVWPRSKAASLRVLSNTSTPMLSGDCVFSARSSGQLVCLDATDGQVRWETDKVTGARGGASIHLTPSGDSVFLYTDAGELIRARLTASGYQELGRARLLEPTYPFGGRKVAWPPPAFSDRHVFARSDTQLVCASLVAEP